MNPFSQRNRSADQRWQVASATPLFTADADTVTRFARESGWHEDGRQVDGVLVARRHPTGWFLHAVRRDTLPANEAELFGELVAVRSHLLLARGPQAPAWRTTADGEWRSVAVAMATELAALGELVTDADGPPAA